MRMLPPDKNMNKQIESLVEITESILRGEFEEWKMVIDAEGMLSILASKINKLLVNMKNVESPLASAGEQAPTAVSSAKNVIELMATATGQVLDYADQLIESSEEMEVLVAQAKEHGENTAGSMEKHLSAIKAGLFDIIGSQSYQDVARQKMEALITDLNQIRDWLIEVLVIFNLKKDNSPENVQKKADLLREVNEETTSEDLKQDLVDDLLSEFGF
jgi:chemotaxis protein CheZ